MFSLKVTTPVLALIVAATVGSATAAPVSQRPVRVDFARREVTAPAAIKQRLATLRSQITAQRLGFRVGYTTAMDEALEKLAGTRAPSDLAVEAPKQNELAARILRVERESADSLERVRPDFTLPDRIIFRGCVASRSTFDWRTLGKVTGVRNQDGCGSCWAFGAIGAYEASYAIRNTSLIDASEQSILSCSGAGSCGGGWHAGVFNYLISTGSGAESAYPYTATDTPCNASKPDPYRAVTWAYVAADGGIPSVAAMKEALCSHGPLTVAVYASPAFQAYTDGTFNEHVTDKGINHDVTLIGWSDPRQAWLIKNSWGTGWGSTCGYGTDKGYMWISYDSNNIGYGAAWVQAKSRWIILPPHYFAMLPHIRPMPPEETPIRRPVTALHP